jgi:hypothetical protein
MKRSVTFGAFGAFLVIVANTSISAQYPTVLQVIPGTKCMTLNLTPEQMIDPKIVVIVREAPDANAPEVGTASATVVVRDPIVARNGHVETLFPNGRTGWIEARLVRPWRPGPGSRPTCTPALMSTGAIGFQYR